MMLSLHYGGGLFSYGQNLLFVWFFLSLFHALIRICMNIFKKGEFLSLSFLLYNFFFGSIFQYHYDCFHFVWLFDSTFFRKAKKNFVFCFWFQVFANVCVCACVVERIPPSALHSRGKMKWIFFQQNNRAEKQTGHLLIHSNVIDFFAYFPMKIVKNYWVENFSENFISFLISKKNSYLRFFFLGCHVCTVWLIQDLTLFGWFWI